MSKTEKLFQGASLEYADLTVAAAFSVDLIKQKRDQEEALEPVGTENIAEHLGRLAKLRAASSLLEEVQTDAAKQYQTLSDGLMIAETAPNEGIRSEAISRMEVASKEISLFWSVMDALHRKIQSI